MPDSQTNAHRLRKYATCYRASNKSADDKPGRLRSHLYLRRGQTCDDIRAHSKPGHIEICSGSHESGMALLVIFCNIFESISRCPMKTTILKHLKTSTKMVLVGAFLSAGLMASRQATAATLMPGYTIGSGALSPNGETLLIDRAQTGGDDSTFADGNLPWSAEIKGDWVPGEEVSITGIAFPIHQATGAGTFTFSFYELDGGADPSAFDGTSSETLAGTATAVFNGLSAASACYVIFDTPVTFTAKSAGIAVHIQNTGNIRVKIRGATAAPRAIRKSNANGSTYVTDPDFWMSLAGTITMPPDFPGTIGVQPTGTTVYQSATVSINNVSYGGQPPLYYQWYLNGTPIANETNPTITLSNVTADLTGNYSVSVQNTYGTGYSSNALVTVIPLYNTAQMTNVWNLLPGDRFYVTSSNSERGLAYNPATSNLLMVSHTPTNNLVVLDPATGIEKGFMNLSGIPDGAGGLSLIAIGDDGVVYGANVIVNAGSASTPYQLFQWDNDQADTVPVALLSGDPGYSTDAAGLRWGDNLAVRGAGSNTQILIAPGSGNDVCFFVTDDGHNFSPVIVPVTGAPSGFGQWGVAFGPGANTFWAKGSGKPLYLAQFDLSTQTAAIIQTYTNVPGSWKLISTDSSNKWLAGVMRVGNNLPDNVGLYDVSNTTNGPVLADQELYATANLGGVLNGIGTGSTAFGGNYLFALDENNGLKAFLINTNYTGELIPFTLTVTRPDANSITLSWPSLAGHNYQVQSRASLAEGDWSDVGQMLNASGSLTSFTNTIENSAQFFRVKTQ